MSLNYKGGITMKRTLKAFWYDESAPTAVEYAIMLALVALAIALATPNIRTAVLNVFNSTSTELNALGAAAAGP